MLHGVDRANVYLVMELGGRCIPCLLDTGCDLTMVPREVMNLVADVEIRPTTHRMWAANGTQVQIDGGDYSIRDGGKKIRYYGVSVARY